MTARNLLTKPRPTPSRTPIRRPSREPAHGAAARNLTIERWRRRSAPGARVMDAEKGKAVHGRGSLYGLALDLRPARAPSPDLLPDPAPRSGGMALSAAERPLSAPAAPGTSGTMTSECIRLHSCCPGATSFVTARPLRAGDATARGLRRTVCLMAAAILACRGVARTIPLETSSSAGKHP